MKSTRQLPRDEPIFWSGTQVLGKNLLGSVRVPNGHFEFVYIPPNESEEPVEVWRMNPFSFEIMGFAVYHPDNLLAVAEHNGR